VGLAIEREDFDEVDYERFATRLQASLEVLEALLKRPGFGEGEASLGAELELALIDGDCRPLPHNELVLGETADPRMTVELDRFNLECNLRHGPLAGRPFTALGQEIEDALAVLDRAAQAHGGRTVMIGILPTLHADDLQASAMTDTARFRALSKALQRLRSEPFRLSIDGADPLDMRCDDVTFEGAATSLQLHLRVAVREFAAVYNAIQIATAPVLAVAGNSPTFLGHRLWEETRVALFKQAVDHRVDDGRIESRQARVSFGTGWVQRSVLELFAEAVAVHVPLLPVMGEEDPRAALEAGGLPRLEEMRLHQGTVWRWNRAIYDPAEGGHIRVEMRALPAGPTPTDMLANCAFQVGLSLGIAEDIEAWLSSLSFEVAHHNFFRAAQRGLGAELVWPEQPGARAAPIAADQLVARLLPIAARGLARAGVEAEEADRLLGVIAERAASGQTGARWQRDSLAALERSRPRDEALALMLQRYRDASSGGEPVHRWPIAGQGVR
jgi:hypothetical protein